MENNKIYIDADEFARLCRLDGAMDAVIRYIENQEKGANFINEEMIRIILGV